MKQSKRQQRREKRGATESNKLRKAKELLKTRILGYEAAIKANPQCGYNKPGSLKVT